MPAHRECRLLLSLFGSLLCISKENGSFASIRKVRMPEKGSSLCINSKEEGKEYGRNYIQH